MIGLPPEVAEKVEQIGTYRYRYGYRGKPTTSWGARGWGAAIMAGWLLEQVCSECGRVEGLERVELSDGHPKTAWCEHDGHVLLSTRAQFLSTPPLPPPRDEGRK